jgi:hypothetical protein
MISDRNLAGNLCFSGIAENKRASSFGYEPNSLKEVINKSAEYSI